MSYTSILHLTTQRGSGRTTRLAMHYVQQALDNPGQWIYVEDHGPAIQADHMLFVLVRDMLRALRVGFEADSRRLAVVCHTPHAGQPTYPSAVECTHAHHRELLEERLREDRRSRKTYTLKA